VPTFKHPCPYCGELVARDAAACPYCATQDPFAPKRCPSCRTPVDDPRWAACPRCGAALGVRPATAASPAATAASPAATGVPAAEPAASDDARPACTGCGAAMPAGARFCLACGTLAG
jgi:predicted amidophosphoribosyltransferase